MDEIQFKSAFDAVRFALCYSSQQYGETLMAKRLRGESTGGMGLVGLDGAGQAGIIRRWMWELPELQLAVLVAQAAPKDHPCSCGSPCCSGWRPNPEWQAAIGCLTKASAAQCGFSHYRVRRAAVERVFGVKRSLEEVAKECDVHINTASSNNAAIRRWIDGNRKTGEAGLRDAAWVAIESRLEGLQLIKEAE